MHVCVGAWVRASACPRTQPEGQALGVEEQAVPLVPLVGGGHVQVAADDPLQVAVLPVQLARLHGPAEHRAPGPRQGVCQRTRTDTQTQTQTHTKFSEIHFFRDDLFMNMCVHFWERLNN